MAKGAALAIAVIAWLGLGIQANATFAQTGDVATTLWVLLRYFTILTNLGVAIGFSALAMGRKLSRRCSVGSFSPSCLSAWST